LRWAALVSLPRVPALRTGHASTAQVVASSAWSETSLLKASVARNNLSAAGAGMKQEHSQLKCGISVASFWCTAQANA